MNVSPFSKNDFPPQPIVRAASGSEFRDDINGLRAIAVIAVFLYHASVPWFRGGYCGVDIFFVISGYLMTAIIHKGLIGETFSPWKFYAARARRIVPALGVMVLVSMSVGYFLLEPIFYGQSAENGLASLLFSSNFWYWRHSGYFDPAAERNLFLHTWSLSVEWQFYLIYPLVLLVLHRFKPSLFRPAVWAGTAFSFAATLVISPKFPSFAFYMLPTRAWEFLIGGLVATFPSAARFDQATRRALSGLGLAALGLSVTCLDPMKSWPSSWTALPVIGTTMVIAADQSSLVWCRNRVVNWVGRTSYSIYLWHWPVLLLARYLIGDLSPVALSLLFPGVMLLSALSYYLVEQKPRQRASLSKPWIVFGVYGAAALAIFGIFALNGLPGRVNQDVARRIEDLRRIHDDWEYPINGCRHVEREHYALRLCDTPSLSANHHILVIGDSFAEQLYPVLRRLSENTPVAATFATHPGCPPVPGVDRVISGSNCDRFFTAALDEAHRDDYDAIVIASIWGPYFYPDEPGFQKLKSGQRSAACLMTARGCESAGPSSPPGALFAPAFDELGADIADLSKHGKHVEIILPTPYGEIDYPSEIAKRLFLGHPYNDIRTIDKRDFEQKTQVVRDLLRRAAVIGGASLLDPSEFLCGRETCPTVSDEDRVLYLDAAHLKSSYLGQSAPFGDLLSPENLYGRAVP